MAGQRKKESTFIGEYLIVKTIKDDTAYKYAEAIKPDGTPVFLQILQASQEVLQKIFDYFDALGAIPGINLFKPDTMVQLNPTSLVLAYPKLLIRPFLTKIVKKEPEQVIDYWEQAAECLHTIHKRRTPVLHGLINSDSFVVVKDKIYLTGFGYAPLLENRHPGIIKEYVDFLAPEIVRSGTISQSSDIYAFAKTLSNWNPRIKETPWYIKATHPEPAMRFTMIREAFNEFEISLKELLNITQKNLPDNKNERQEKKQGSALIPKYRVEIDVIPTEGGVVSGAALYARGSKATLTATPNIGWEFQKWSGSIENIENTISIVVDAEKKLTAQFRMKPEDSTDSIEVTLDQTGGEMVKHEEKLTVDTCTIVVKADPAEAGKVIGGGTYSTGQSWPIQAIPANGWQFAEWTGDVSGKQNPLIIAVDSNKHITGNFIRQNKVVLSQSSNPPEVGVTNINQYHSLNSKLKITARAADPTQWVFQHWSGDISGSVNPILVLMNADKHIVANFVKHNSCGKNQEPKADSTQQKKPSILGEAFKVGNASADQKQNNTSGGTIKRDEATKPKIGDAFDNASVKESEPEKSKNKKKKEGSPLGGAFK